LVAAFQRGDTSLEVPEFPSAQAGRCAADRGSTGNGLVENYWTRRPAALLSLTGIRQDQEVELCDTMEPI
jgi:hypothetical protein